MNSDKIFDLTARGLGWLISRWLRGDKKREMLERLAKASDLKATLEERGQSLAEVRSFLDKAEKRQQPAPDGQVLQEPQELVGEIRSRMLNSQIELHELLAVYSGGYAVVLKENGLHHLDRQRQLAEATFATALAIIQEHNPSSDWLPHLRDYADRLDLRV